MNITRLRQSREEWKRTAIERRLLVESLKRKNEVLRRKVQSAEAEVRACQQKMREMNVQTPVAAVQTVLKIEVRVVCILLFLTGFVPCNAVARILGFLAESNRVNCDWIPHPSSIVNWVARAGLGFLDAVAPVTVPWVAIIDSSIAYGKAKMLVCLRVPLAHFASGCGAVGLEHVECVGLEIRDSWTGEDVKSALESIFKKAGMPTAILKDQGPDLKRGVELLRKDHSSIHVIRDLGHVAACALKKHYERNTVLARFLRIVDGARAKLTHSEAASLRPPKIRVKGRFQGISRIADWALKVLDLIAGPGRAEHGSLRARLRLAVPGLAVMRPFLERFARDCIVVKDVLTILKRRGLQDESYAAVATLLDTLPNRTLRKKLRAWLEETRVIQQSVKVPLLVSSDVIESLFGLVKAVLERTPTPEFGTLALATPLFCGRRTEEEVRAALQRCPHKMLKRWRLENLRRTHRNARRRLLDDASGQEVRDSSRAQAS